MVDYLKCRRVHIDKERLLNVTFLVWWEVMDRFKLDFDDAYQYCSAEKYHLTLVSFDGDFDRTDRGRMTPEHVR